MTVKLLTEQHLKFISLKGGCASLFESNYVKMPHRWISRVVAHFTIVWSLVATSRSFAEKFDR